MKKITLFLLAFFALHASGQVGIVQSFPTTTTPTGWDVGGGFLTTTQSCASASWRANLYSFVPSATLLSEIQVSNGADLTLSFDYKVVDWSDETVATSPFNGNIITELSVDGGTTWSITAGTVNNANHTVSNTCANVSYVIPGASLPSGANVRIRWRCNFGTSGDYYVYLDNISATQPTTTPPLCTTLSNPANNALNVSSTILTWTAASGIPTGYNLTVGSTPGGTEVLNNFNVGNVLSYNVGPLDPGTTYYVTVNPYNQNGTATNCTETNFTTCDVFMTPFTETFDSASPSKSCWSVVNANNDGIQWNLNYAFNPFVGNQVAVINTDFNNGANNDWLITPKISLSPNQRLRFNYRVQSSFEPNDFRVMLSTTGNAPADFTEVLLPLAQYSNTTYIERSIDLTAFGGEEVFIAWHVPPGGLDGWILYIDNVIIEDIPVGVPSCVAITTPANNALDVSIETAFTWAANIDATGYTIQIGTSPGGDDFLESTDVGNVLSYTPATPLEYSTDYFVTVTPYNATGPAVDCDEITFVTRDAPPTGSICADPIIISQSSLPYTTTDNTNVYGDDYSTSICNTNYMGGDEVIYTFTPTTNTSINIVLSNLGGTWSGIHVLNGCPNTATTCHAFVGNAGTTDRVINDFAVTAGQTYFIVISTFPAPQSVSYTLTITENTCVNPTATYSVTNNCPTETFNVVANITDLGTATSLTVSDNQSSAPQVVSATGLVTFGPYPLGTNVVLSIANDQDSNCFLTSPTQTVAACPPANDLCANAIALTPGAVFSTNPLVGTNVGATNNPSDPVPTCDNFNFATLGKDVWYTVTVPASGSITVETNNNSDAGMTDTGLEIYSGTCGALTLVECNADSSTDGNFSIISLTNRTEGEVLLIRVWGYNANVGSFQVSAYDASLSSSNFDSNNFAAYPNPVNNILNLSYTSEISDVRVLNMLGQVVLTKKLNANNGQLDVSPLSAGTYIVNVTIGDTVKSIKVVKQ